MSTAALTLPVTQEVAAAATTTVKPKKKVLTTTKKVTGTEAQVSRWGTVEVVLTVRKTTTTVGKKKTIVRHITGVTVPIYPNPHRPLGLHQPAGAPVPGAGGHAGAAEPEHPARLRRDRHELRIHRVIAVRDPAGEEGLMIEPGVRRVEHIMGMPILVDVRDDDVDAAVFDVVFEWLRFVDATYSTYKDDSQISLLNSGELAEDEVRFDVRAVLEHCEQLRVETDGYFDVRAFSRFRVDPSGFVKGWSVDAAAAMLNSASARNYAVYAGGDIRTRGKPLPDDAWRVGIQHPVERNAVAGIVELTDAAIATSGEYRRGAHIADPHTGMAPHGVLSVTLTGVELATADAYATAIFAMGSERGPAWLGSLPSGYDALMILDDGRVLSTPGFPLTTRSQALPDRASVAHALMEACT
jgi:thiamine biosynthesis lipoprotein